MLYPKGDRQVPPRAKRANGDGDVGHTRQESFNVVDIDNRRFFASLTVGESKLQHESNMQTCKRVPHQNTIPTFGVKNSTIIAC